MPPIQESTEERLNLIFMCNQDEFFVEPKEVEQDIILEVSTTVEIFKVDKS